jgi:hypothetical protein
VSESERRDRSAAAVPGAEPSAAVSDGATTGAPGTDAGGGLAGALAAALSKRKKKVAGSGKLCCLWMIYASDDANCKQMTRKKTMTTGRREENGCLGHLQL